MKEIKYQVRVNIPSETVKVVEIGGNGFTLVKYEDDLIHRMFRDNYYYTNGRPLSRNVQIVDTKVPQWLVERIVAYKASHVLQAYRSAIYFNDLSVPLISALYYEALDRAKVCKLKQQDYDPVLQE